MTPTHIANQKKLANSVAPPGRSSSPPNGSWQNQEQGTPLMCCLAAGVRPPPGGFWKKNPKFLAFAPLSNENCRK